MKYWQEDLPGATEGVPCEQATFKKIETVGRMLGYEHCAFGLRIAHSFSSHKTIVLNNYTASWRVQYVNEGYLHTDSTVLHGRRTHTPLNWNDKVSSSAHWLWNKATCCFET